jgi:hypothetical protein
MNAVLRTLDDLAYVIECAALDFLGEGRSELGKLCDKLENDAEYVFYGREDILAGLREALACYRRDDKIDGTIRVTQVSRALWQMAGGPSRTQANPDGGEQHG